MVHHHSTTPKQGKQTTRILLNVIIFIVVLKVLFLSINSFGMLITDWYHSCKVCSDNSVLELNTTVFGLEEMEHFAATTLVGLLWH